MAKPRDHAVQLPRWLVGEARFDIGPYLRTLPDDIDPAIAVPVILKLFERHSSFFFGRTCKKLPAHVIRALLAEDRATPALLFLRLAVVDEPARVAESWERAVQALLDLDLTYAWGSKQRRARFQQLAADAQILQAIQGTVAHSTNVSRDMLAVLVADGSDASLDALVPHLDAALVDRDRRLERLRDLRIHAKQTPALDALFAEIDATLDERDAASPALALGPVIGIGRVEPLWFWAWVFDAPGEVQANVSIDSRDADWFRAGVSHAGTHHTCADAHALPAWLAQLEVDLGIRWDRVEMVQSGLRGAKREAIGRWLLSLSATTRR